MNETHIERISTELSFTPQQVKATALLLEEGATIPFIARYRKEATNSLDEVAITAIRDRLARARRTGQPQGSYFTLSRRARAFD